jgi:hypothetical protein
MNERITVGIVVPLDIGGRAYVMVGEIKGKSLVVDRIEWEKKRPKKARMKCFYWNGLHGDLARIVPAPDLVPE